MLPSFAFIFLLGLLLGALLKKLGLSPLVGFLAAGIVLGPYGLGLLDKELLAISGQLRQVALVIILLRAGLTLDLADLRRVGRSAVLMCFAPACFEMAGTILVAPWLFGISRLEAAVLGAVLAAVSPAVIVPKMIKLMEEGYGTKKGIPQMILAGASVDDVFVIVLFTAFTGLAKGQGFHAAGRLQIPLSIVLGVLAGAVCGMALAWLFARVHMRDTVKVVVLLSAAFLLLGLESTLEARIGFSALLGVMAAGAVLYRQQRQVAGRLSQKFAKLWVAAEVLLFVLVGATVDVRLAVTAGGRAVLLLGIVLLFRAAGVYVSTARSGLTQKERLFCIIAYLPKATVQAAIGGLPLAMGLSCGPLVLTVAVLAILITAPLGAFGIDATYKRLLQRE